MKDFLWLLSSAFLIIYFMTQETPEYPISEPFEAIVPDSSRVPLQFDWEHNRYIYADEAHKYTRINTGWYLNDSLQHKLNQ